MFWAGTAGTVVGLALSVLAVVLGIVLGAREYSQRRELPESGQALDAFYYYRQYRRRLAGAVLMVMTGGLLAAGVLIDPRSGLLARQLWSASWLAVLCLLMILPILAFLDWLAISLYARRKRLDLEQERAVLLAALGKLKPAGRVVPESPNGKHDR